MSKIAFVGGGSFGTALAVLLSKKGEECTIWCHSQSSVDEINNKRENERYLKGIKIPDSITAYSDLKEAVEGADVIVLSVPSKAIREVSKKVAPLLKGHEIIVTVAKGIEKQTLKRMSEIIEDEISKLPLDLKNEGSKSLGKA